MSELEQESSLFSRGVTGSAIEEVLLTSLLYSSPDINDLVNSTRMKGKSSVKVALDYIDANIEDEITTLNLVDAVGVSLRKLQYDFSQQLGVGPMTKVRQEKLKRVRCHLKKANGQSTTVADVAAIWGFFDRRYFTKIYKEEFGELPSVTLGSSY